MIDRRKGNLVWLVVGVCVIIFALLSIQINQMMTVQNDMVKDLSEVEYLSSSTQRLTRMVVTGNKDNKVMFYIDEQSQ